MWNWMKKYRGWIYTAAVIVVLLVVGPLLYKRLTVWWSTSTTTTTTTVPVTQTTLATSGGSPTTTTTLAPVSVGSAPAIPPNLVTRDDLAKLTRRVDDGFDRLVKVIEESKKAEPPKKEEDWKLTRLPQNRSSKARR